MSGGSFIVGLAGCIHSCCERLVECIRVIVGNFVFWWILAVFIIVVFDKISCSGWSVRDMGWEERTTYSWDRLSSLTNLWECTSQSRLSERSSSEICLLLIKWALINEFVDERDLFFVAGDCWLPSWLCDFLLRSRGLLFKINPSFKKKGLQNERGVRHFQRQRAKTVLSKVNCQNEYGSSLSIPYSKLGLIKHFVKRKDQTRRAVYGHLARV